MPKLSKYVAQGIAEWERLSRQNKSRVFTSDLAKDVSIRRQNLLGDYVCEIFPDVLDRPLHDSEAANRKEFEFLINLLLWAKDNKLRMQSENEAPQEAE